MNVRLKKIADNLDILKIGVDEPFKFHCTQCGKCCINREDILLSLKDVYNISKELKMTPEQMVKQYCEVYIGDSSRIPIVRLRPQGSIKRCPFLKDRKCSVHHVKPIVCAMFPIGRCIRMDPEQYGKERLHTSQIEFIFTAPDCGDDAETHTVREWLGKFAIPLEDEFFVNWNSVVSECGVLLHKLEKKYPETVMRRVWSQAFFMLYLEYDVCQELFPQFDRNSTLLVELLKELLDAV